MSKLYLAPMQGLTDAAFRLICFERGCDGAVTEMIETGTYANTRKKLAQIEQTLIRLPGEGELSVQLIGKQPQEMAVCAERVSLMRRFDAIEVNMGCPARKVVTGGSGSALMKDPKRAREILRAVREHTDLPVHLKMRLGWDEEHRNAVEIARLAEEEGICRLTVHGRTRAQFYSGEADCAGIAEVVRAVQMPVVANGAVQQAASARPFLQKTGACAVSIGRAALTNPWIFEEIRRLEAGEPLPVHGAQERCALLLQHARLACTIREEREAVLRLRKVVPWYLEGLSGLDELRAAVNRLESLQDFESEVRAFERRLPHLLPAG